MSEEKSVKVVQITSSEGHIYGLGEDNKVYIWTHRRQNDSYLWMLYDQKFMHTTICVPLDVEEK